ncbi:MAG: rhomboid family intramembrane serine protease [Elusimicrobiota bacterium]
MIPLRDNIPSSKIPFINYFLIAVNTVVFLFELKLSAIMLDTGHTVLEGFIYKFGAVPLRLFSDFFSQFYTVFTSMFIHGGWTHFIGNMLYLYIFGDNVEDSYGHLKYLFVYVACGVVAALLQSALAFGSNLPMVGASGAIAGVLGSYVLLYPRARVDTLIFFGFFVRIIQIPALLYLGFWFIIQTLSGTMSLAATTVTGRDIGGVAFWAHIGGFIAGAIFVFLLIKRRRARRFF